MSNKNLHLIIDGPDRVGKTTAIECLSKKLKLHVIKMTGVKIDSSNIEALSKLFNETIVQFRYIDFILDRGFPSSLVYSKVFKRKIDLSYVWTVDRMLDPTVVILTRKHPIESDDQVDESSWYHLRDEYQKLAKKKNWILIDTTELSKKQVCQKILENI